MPQWHIKSVVIFAIHYTEKGSVLLELSLENGFHLFTNLSVSTAKDLTETQNKHTNEIK